MGRQKIQIQKISSHTKIIEAHESEEVYHAIFAMNYSLFPHFRRKYNNNKHNHRLLLVHVHVQADTCTSRRSRSLNEDATMT
jgi:predicted transposase YbfD/YdcC